VASVLLGVGALGSAAQASRTYHLGAGGKDANPGTADRPWATFAQAWMVLRPGDTLVVGDGSYTSASPPREHAGTAQAPISLRAANPGGARLLGPIEFRGNAHLAFSGFLVQGVDNAIQIRSNGPGKVSHHLTFQQLGFTCMAGMLNDDACFSLADGTHHVLLEDSWGWGGGRYTVLAYGGPGGNPANITCDHNTFRRVVLRMGPSQSSPTNPQAALALYYASHNIVENVVAIDGRPASDSSNAAFYVTAHAAPPASNGNRFLGVVAFNHWGVGFYLDCPGAQCDAVEVRDSVLWGSPKGALAIASRQRPGESCDAAVIDHNTLAFAGGRNNGYENYACRDATFTNNAAFSNGGYGARQSPTAGSTRPVKSNGYFANAAGARSNVASGDGDRNADPRFRHLLRIEADSPYRGAGTSGDIGANVVLRYQDGRLTSEALWPWPFEDRLRAEMCATPGPGFCASGKSLTRYLWEALGNPAPARFER
jgi:hypothetical protein